MQTMTKEQEWDIIEQSLAADEAGEHEKSTKLLKQLPLSPHLAKAAKEIFGKDYVLNAGFNLSAAEAEYGKDWLN